MGRRVLHLINGQHFGGASRVLVNYLEAGSRRADVAVGLFFYGELERRLASLGVATAVIPMRNRLDLRAAREVVRLARRFNADILHTHQVRNTLIGRLAAKVDGRRVVTHVHSPAFRESTSWTRNTLTGAIDRLLLPMSDRFVAVSASLAAELSRAGVRSDRVRVVHNGIPIPVTQSAEELRRVREELDLRDDFPVIGMTALFRPRKGTEVLLEAVARLRRRLPQARLLLVGPSFDGPGGAYGAQLRALASELDIADRTTFTGFRQDVARMLGALDLFVLPSLFGEGMPMALLEAMGAGVPVVSTPVEGIGELIADGENGLLVPAGNVDSLADAIERIASDDAFRAATASAGRATVETEYSAERMAAGLEGVYAELIGS